MSPHYEPDFGAVSATLHIFDKGELEFEIGKPKAFQREKKKGGESIGVRYRMTATEGADSGKSGMYTCYTHSEGGLAFAKQFIMAALGFEVNQAGEKEFNAQYGKGADWSFDTENGECGELWDDVAGKRVMASVDIQANPETGEPGQQWTKFRPVK